MNAGTERIIEQRLQQALQPLHFELHNDSHLHVGHAGNRGGGHYSVLIVSQAFAGQSRLQRQRLVKDALQDLFAEQIHALSIRAASPEEYFGSSPDNG